MIAAGIEYAEAGTGPAVVCLHGIGGGIDSFAPQMALPGVRVIAVNLPGYGASDALCPITFADISARLSDFLAALGLPSAHFVGQSIGGMIALDHALRCPEQVTSLSLIGTTPAFGGRDDRFKTDFLKARLAPLEAGQTMTQMAKSAAPHLVGPEASEDVQEAIAAPMAQVSETTWRAILECLVTFNRRDDLALVTQPTCLIAGGYDQNAPSRTMQKMAAKIPRAAYHLIEGAGHMINQEYPTETNAILTSFLENHR